VPDELEGLARTQVTAKRSHARRVYLQHLLERGEEELGYPRVAGLEGRPAMREITITETPRAAGPEGVTVVDVMASQMAGDDGSHDATVPAQREETRQAAGKYEREVATLDLTDAAQAMARAQPGGDVDAPVDSSQVDLATGLYASADRHRRLAERLESGDDAPGVPGEVP
jgi:hypothetical protein